MVNIKNKMETVLKLELGALYDLQIQKQDELSALKFKLANASLKDTSEIRKIRKDIARINMVIQSKELEKDGE